MLQRRSLSTVEITWIERIPLLEALRLRAERVCHEDSQVRKIILYGSIARNEQTPASDIDLLILVSECSIPFLKRRDSYAPYFEGLPLDADVKVYTENEIEMMEHEANPFILSALKEGIDLGCEKSG